MMPTVFNLQSFAQAYLNSRTSTYKMRCVRYNAVYRLLRDRLKLDHWGSSVLDLGAGRLDFQQFLREKGFRGEYCPIDASIDGTDLETWEPPAHTYSVTVAIEVIEHLHHTERFLKKVMASCIRGAVITTPNDHVISVLDCDPTHVSIIQPEWLLDYGWTVKYQQLFAKPNDSIIAYYLKE